MSIEDDLNKARLLFEKLDLKAIADDDAEKHEIYNALYSVADAVYHLGKDIELIRIVMQEIKDRQ